MMPDLNTRRSFLLGLAVTTAASRARASGSSPEDRIALASGRLAAIEKHEGGRLGVTVLDSGGGPPLEHRADERFPMCSTFKLLASAAVLKRVDEGNERLDRVIPYGPADLLEYAPVAKAHVADGGMTLGDLCAAAIDWSDNTAANLILDAIGGPAGFTAFARSLGDSTTRLDRNEPDAQCVGPRRRARHDDAAGDGRDAQKALLGASSPKPRAANSRPGSSTTRSAARGCAPGSLHPGRSATRPAAATTARRM